MTVERLYLDILANRDLESLRKLLLKERDKLRTTLRALESRESLKNE